MPLYLLQRCSEREKDDGDHDTRWWKGKGFSEVIGSSTATNVSDSYQRQGRRKGGSISEPYLVSWLSVVAIEIQLSKEASTITDEVCGFLRFS